MKKLLFLLLMLPTVALARDGTFTADGSSSTLSCDTGIVYIALDHQSASTWGGGTVTAEYLHPEGDYRSILISGVAKTWTADATENIDLSGPSTFRLTMSGSTTPNVDYYLNCQQRR